MAANRTELLPMELQSLRQLTRVTVKKPIPDAHGAKLVRCGFAEMRAGKLIITTRGHAKLAFEITRSSWFAMRV
ncbi:MAG TPA: hypothetical protein VGA25_01175 [Burkholderiales bacterium]